LAASQARAVDRRWRTYWSIRLEPVRLASREHEGFRPRSPPAPPGILGGMFHTGDRVLVCTTYGELLAVVLGVIHAGTRRQPCCRVPAVHRKLM